MAPERGRLKKALECPGWLSYSRHGPRFDGQRSKAYYNPTFQMFLWIPLHKCPAWRGNPCAGNVGALSGKIGKWEERLDASHLLWTSESCGFSVPKIQAPFSKHVFKMYPSINTYLVITCPSKRHPRCWACSWTWTGFLPLTFTSSLEGIRI